MMLNRRSHAKEVADAGFDSKVEADKMLKFYLNAKNQLQKLARLFSALDK